MAMLAWLGVWHGSRAPEGPEGHATHGEMRDRVPLAWSLMSEADAHPADASSHSRLRSLGPRGPAHLGGFVYGRQELPLKFSHAQHIARGMQCTSCHSNIDRSDHVRDRNLPTAESCDRCHGPQHPLPVGANAHCESCHVGARDQRITQVVSLPTARLVFSHARHLSRGATCENCHAGMSEVGLATVMQLPTEADCLACHDGEKADRTCSTCHPSDGQGRLLTRAAADRRAPPLIPRGASSRGMNHDLDFVRNHATVAKSRRDQCSTCHADAFCVECHEGDTRPMRIHEGDYLRTHGWQARAGTNDCQSCHRLQTDCRGCHVRLGLGSPTARQPSESNFGRGASLRFHPDGWANTTTGGRHSMAARRNLSNCASCHDEDSCLACHATAGSQVRSGLGVSPHGPNFASSPRCQALAARNRRVCLQCHAPGDIMLNCETR